MGGPTSLVFTVTWQTNDGVVHDSMPAPDVFGFGAMSFNAGGKEMGTATCTQAVGATELVCDYQNQGHGSLPGLVLPMSPKATFTVSLTSAVPTGWKVDPTTIGTFTGGEACPARTAATKVRTAATRVVEEATRVVKAATRPPRRSSPPHPLPRTVAKVAKVARNPGSATTTSH